jgi:hypothetical protein
MVVLFPVDICEPIMFLGTEEKVPIGQRYICGCFAVIGALFLPWAFIMYFIVDPVSPSLEFIASFSFLFPYGVSLFARVAAEGKLSEPTPEGRISPWLRVGFGAGTVISLTGITRVLIDVTGGNTELNLKEGIYLTLIALLLCFSTYLAVTGKTYKKKET